MKAKIIALVLALTGLPSLALAQWSIGPHIVISVPSSDFANVSGVGGGFGVKVIRNLSSPNKGFGLRGDFAFLSHGEDIQAVQTISGPFPAEVRQESFRLTFGPQFSLGTGSVRGQVGILGGFYIFRTNVNLQTNIGFFSGEQDSDAAVGWNVGGGIQYDIGLGPLLDLAVEYQTIYNIPAEFSVEDNAGEMEIVERDITAHEITVKLGVTFFLGK